MKSSIFLLAFGLLFSLSAMAQKPSELVNKSINKINEGKYQEGIKLCNEAIALDPEYLDAYLKRAFAYSALKEYQKAIDDYTKVISLKPENVLAYISRGSAYDKLKNYKMALNDYNKAIELDPKNAEVYNNRGWVKKAMGDHKGACSDWKTSKKMGNGEAKIILKNNDC